MATLGFVGLGRMGGPMAGHLARAGHEVHLYDVRPEAVAAVPGGTTAPSLAALGAAANVVFLSLPGPLAVRDVAGELAEHLSPGDVLVDTTTSTPKTTRAIADRMGEHDVDVLGAPISGGTDGAAGGSLTVMVGGDPAVFERCRPYVETFADRIVHVGDAPGHGHAVKLLNNYLSITAMLATSEAVVLGQAAGLDVETMCEVFNASTGRNSATEDKFPECVTADRSVGFALSLLTKDIGLLTDFAQDEDIPLMLARIVEGDAERTRAAYGDDGDMTDIYQYVRDACGVG